MTEQRAAEARRGGSPTYGGGLRSGGASEAHAPNDKRGSPRRVAPALFLCYVRRAAGAGEAGARRRGLHPAGWEEHGEALGWIMRGLWEGLARIRAGLCEAHGRD